ncbi:MAG TPA: cytochrome P450 [Myxococcales bacterium]
MTHASRAEFEAAREAEGPEAVSLWRVLRGYRPDPLQRWTSLRERHGDVAGYRVGFTDVCFVSSAEGARRVLQENAGNYTKDHPAYAMIRRLVGNGLLTSEGSFWLRQRRLAQPAFHRERIAGMAGQMVAAAVEMAAAWERLSARGEPVPMAGEMSRLTLKVAGEALFGTQLGETTARVAAAWDVLNRQLVERFNRRRLFPPVLPTRYDRDFRKARRTMLEIVEEIIAQRRARGGQTADLLSMLMHARDEETGEQMTDAQLRDEVATMMLAGHETTAIALSWTWALLDRHRHARAGLDAELTRVLAGRLPTAEDVSRLRYTRAVIEESMRLYPPAWILHRRTVEDDVVCGRRIHRGAVVVMSPMILHRHPAYWERPDEFLPARWEDAEAEKRRPRFAYLPFSAGPRQCIGNGFAMMEAVLVLAVLAQRFDPRLADGYELKPQYLVTLRPALGLPMRIEGVALSPRRHFGLQEGVNRHS